LVSLAPLSFDPASLRQTCRSPGWPRVGVSTTGERATRFSPCVWCL
jgi:hypothetical protein